ncbi:gas vesicle protein K [Streptomyces sp. YS-3]|uniref:gas vesicle protein K n=1 Tax=Streptomyces sp. YS-3 TaxID=3381352 RepID=UPI0038623E25
MSVGSLAGPSALPGCAAGGRAGDLRRSHRDRQAALAHRIHTDPDTVGEDLLKLVLTLVELLRQLIERQTLRRVDVGNRRPGRRAGSHLLALHDSLAALCTEHGYAEEDLNLGLGQLGTLLRARSEAPRTRGTPHSCRTTALVWGSVSAPVTSRNGSRTRRG